MCCAAPVLAADDAERLVADARAARLAEDPAWRKLLLARPTWFGGPESVVDSPAYFFAPDEARTLGDELEATIRAFVSTQVQAFDEPDERPACRFPARFAFLGEHLPEFRARVRKPDCPAYARWRAIMGDEKVSFVFSSYFANNPSSLFGHTFLRFHKASTPERQAVAMLDDSVNFTAYPNTSNPLIYGLRGGVGGFPGRFSVSPLYVKIQEYNNSDSRDLWEYELTLSKAEIERLIQLVWELGPHTIDYYYFDENCALILTMLIEAARPTVDLSPLHPWVIPADSLRVIARAPGLVQRVEHRPSVLTRFQARYRALSPGERDVVDDLVSANDPAQALPVLRALPPESAAAVIDSVVEFIDHAEKIAGTKEAVEHGPLRKALLVMRATLRVPRREIVITPPAMERPDRGGGTARIGGAAGWSREDGAFVEAEWRPALHDLAEPDIGLTRGLAITFFDTVVRARRDPGEAYLQSWHPLTIFAVPNLEPVVRPYAWNFALGMENIGACTRPSAGCFRKGIGGGIGPALTIGAFTGYLLGQVRLGSSGEAGFGSFAEAGARSGASYPLSDSQKVSLAVSAGRLFGEAAAVADTRLAIAEWVALFDERWETRLVVQGDQRTFEVLAGMHVFY